MNQTGMYKLIAHQTASGPTPFYNYVLKDSDGNEVSGVTKAIITIEPDSSFYPKLTFQRKYTDDGKTFREETVGGVDVDIDVVQTPR